MPRVFPLDTPLTYSTLLDRLERYCKESGALRFYRTPNPESRYRVLAKDNIGAAPWPTSAGSHALIDLHVPDAAVVKRLRSHGCDIFGKTHLTELAGFVTVNALQMGYSQLGGQGRNPHGDFPTSGSSVGSAVAVAVGLCDAALGTETRGSLMCPALRNGIWAYKPTLGRYSRDGIIPLSRHFDTPGWMARDIDTIVELDRLTQWCDPNDSACVAYANTDVVLKTAPIRRLGILLNPALSQDQALRFNRWVDSARRLGFETLFVACPTTDFDYHYLVGEAFLQDMSAFLARHAAAGQPHSATELIERYRNNPLSRPFGMERLENALKQPHLSPEALDARANDARQLARDTIASICSNYDVEALVTPTYLDWWAIGGAPSVAVPIDFLSTGEPTGVMIGTREHDDERLLQLAQSLASIARR